MLYALLISLCAFWSGISTLNKRRKKCAHTYCNQLCMRLPGETKQRWIIRKSKEKSEICNNMFVFLYFYSGRRLTYFRHFILFMLRQCLLVKDLHYPLLRKLFASVKYGFFDFFLGLFYFFVFNIFYVRDKRINIAQFFA